MGRRRLQRVGWRVLYWRGMQGRHTSAIVTATPAATTSTARRTWRIAFISPGCP